MVRNQEHEAHWGFSHTAVEERPGAVSGVCLMSSGHEKLAVVQAPNVARWLTRRQGTTVRI